MNQYHQTSQDITDGKQQELNGTQYILNQLITLQNYTIRIIRKSNYLINREKINKTTVILLFEIFTVR